MAFCRLGAIALLLSVPPTLAVKPAAAQSGGGSTLLAQAPLTPQEKEKARREHEQKGPEKGPPAVHPQPKAALPSQGPPQGLPKGQGANAPAGLPPEHKAAIPQVPPKGQGLMPPAGSPPPEHKAGIPPQGPPKGPGATPALTPPDHKAVIPPAGQRPGTPQPPPAGQAMTAPGVQPEHKGLPQPPGKAPATMQKPPPAGPQGAASAAPSGRPPATAFQLPPHPAGPAPRVEGLQKARQTRVEDGGRRTVIVEPGNRTIIKQDNRVIIRHDDGERFRLLGGSNARTERRPDGLVETFYVRPDGVRIVSVVDANGRLIRRYRRGVDGVEVNIIDNRRFWGAAAAVGVGALAVGVLLNLPPPVITLPPERYIVAYDRASDDDLYEALSAEPIERLDRAYALEEIRDNYALRQRLRRIDLDTIHFEFGSWQVPEDQYPQLERIARIMLRMLDRNPDEVFLISAFTDAVGSDVDNLSLSDRRAESVAEILSASFGVPPENLVTQGYGSQFLLIDTPAAEPRNRRVEIQRITPLMAQR